MPFTVPKEMTSGRFEPYDSGKEPLGPGQRCAICGQTDPQEYLKCERELCVPARVTLRIDERGFTAPKPLVSAFELAARMRRKALSLDWDEDGERNRLMLRARELEQGDSAEVPDEDI